MKSVITGKDILKILLQCTDSIGIYLLNIVSVTTDGAPAIVGKHKSVMVLLKKRTINLIHKCNMIILHCVIYQKHCMRGHQTFKVL